MHVLKFLTLFTVNFLVPAIIRLGSLEARPPPPK